MPGSHAKKTGRWRSLPSVSALGGRSLRVPPSADLEKQQGTWTAISFRRDGQETPKEIVRTITRTVEGDHVVWKRNGKSFAGTALALDPHQDPRAIDVIADGGPTRGKRVLGIYKLENDRLTLCMADADQPRPREFKAEKGSGHTLMVFMRQGAAGQAVSVIPNLAPSGWRSPLCRKSLDRIAEHRPGHDAVHAAARNPRELADRACRPREASSPRPCGSGLLDRPAGAQRSSACRRNRPGE